MRHATMSRRSLQVAPALLIAAAIGLPNLAGLPTKAKTTTSPATEPALRLDSGAADPAAGWSADATVSGGLSVPVTGTITGATAQAGTAMYRTVRVGTFSYLLTGLSPSTAQVVRLHFVEPDQGKGKRHLNVEANGRRLLKNFDINVAAGGLNRAVAQDFPVITDVQGRLLITVSASKGVGLLAGLELFSPVGQSPQPTPSQTATTTPTATSTTTATTSPTATATATATATPTATSTGTTAPPTTPAPTSSLPTTPAPTTPAPTAGLLFPAGKTVNVMATGDSITFGIGDGGPGTAGLTAPHGGYRFPLWDAMAAHGWAFKPVGPNAYPPNPPYATDSPWNGSGWAGWPGWSIRDLLGIGDLNTTTANSIGTWMTDYRPDLLLVHIGTNGGSSYDTRRADFESLIATAQAANPDVVIVMAQIIQNQARTFTYVDDTNAMIRDVVADQQAAGHRVYTVDMAGALTDPGDYWDDVHPSTQGYQKMAAAWMQRLVELDRGNGN